MIKFKMGNISNKDGVSKDIIVKALAPNKLKDALIGGGLVMAGIAYLTTTAFREGAKEFDRAELNTMKDLGIIDWDPNEVLVD